MAITECPIAPIDDVMAVLRVELPSRLTDAASGSGYEITIKCSDRVATVIASSRSRRARVARTSLEGARADLRPRIVALAVAELVRDLDQQAETAQSPDTTQPAEAKLTTQPVEPSSGDFSTWGSGSTGPVHLSAFAETSTFRFDGQWLGGGGLRFEYDTSHLSAGVDAAVLSSDERFAFGSSESLLAYLSPFAGWRGAMGQLSISIGAGYALGAARLSGQATDPTYLASTLSAKWSAPYGFAALAFAMAPAVRIEGRVQAGWVTAPVVGQVAQGEDVRFEDLWTSAQIGLSVDL